MRRLIVNADDFGLTTGVNQAIAEAHSGGIVTSTTLMANGRALADAVQAARRHPTLTIGCHIVLVDGEPVLRGDQVRSLLGNRRFASRAIGSRVTRAVREVGSASGKRAAFNNGFLDLARLAISKRLRPDEVEHEARAQIMKLQDAGIAVSHIDSHKHVHMIPAVCDALLRAAKACGVPCIRNPFVPLAPLAFSHLVKRPKLWRRYSEVRILQRWGATFSRRVAEQGLRTTDGSFGIIVTGALDEKLFRAIAASIPDGTWEFVCHPGYNDEELGNVRTRLRESRRIELKILTSAMARDVLREHGIQLISYRDLSQHPD